MSFKLNTNVNALNSHAQGTFNNRMLQASLEKLSSGLRINKAADDASGMAIADALRSQGNTLGQAIRNTNDGIGIIQIADKAMDEQIKILDSIKVKATQAAQDGQTASTRKAIQADIARLIGSLDNVANTTSFNGQALLSGSFSNKEFQIGAYSHQTIKASIGATGSNKIGQVRLETSKEIDVDKGKDSLVEAKLKFKNVDGIRDVELEAVRISTSAGTGVGTLAEVINKNSNALGVRASWSVVATGETAVASGSVKNLVINGVSLGTITDVQKNDNDGKLVAAINSVKEQTGVQASVDQKGRLNLTSVDGRAISVKVFSGTSHLGNGSFTKASEAGGAVSIGRLTLTRLDARDILISGTNHDKIGLKDGVAQATVNLRDLVGQMNSNVASAAGANTNATLAKDNLSGIGTGVTSLRGAMVAMDIAEAAIKSLNAIRSDLGSVQNQMTSTINNITITQVNVKAAESNIREVDFAKESAEFNKYSFLAQAGGYVMSQANFSHQVLMRLLN